MELNKKEIFALHATLKTSFGNVERVNQFNRIYCVKKIQEIAKSNTYYNSELKMSFQNNDLQESIYELELYKNYLTLEKKLKKGSEFIRRIGYSNDWMQIRANQKGEILSIENREELAARWTKIKKSLLKEYVGETVTDYIEKVEKKLTSYEPFLPSLRQYYFFGLLLPPIPVSHHDGWETTRLVELSDYENQLFEERIIFKNSDDELNYYQISGNVIADNNTFELESWEGIYTKARQDIFPTTANVEVVIKNGNYTSHWTFKLEKY